MLQIYKIFFIYTNKTFTFCSKPFFPKTERVEGVTSVTGVTALFAPSSTPLNTYLYK